MRTEPDPAARADAPAGAASRQSNPSEHTAERLCMLCQVNPVPPGKSVCTTCWRLAPGWVKKSFMRGERIEWSRLLGPRPTPPTTSEED